MADNPSLPPYLTAYMNPRPSKEANESRLSIPTLCLLISTLILYPHPMHASSASPPRLLQARYTFCLINPLYPSGYTESLLKASIPVMYILHLRRLVTDFWENVVVSSLETKMSLNYASALDLCPTFGQRIVGSSLKVKMSPSEAKLHS